MPLDDITGEVLAQCFAKVSDPVKGFNPLYAAEVVAAPLLVKPIVIDFSDPSNNFIFGQIGDADKLEQSGFIKYPLMNMYALESANGNLEKFNRFAGQIRVAMEFWVSFPGQRQAFNYEIPLNKIEAVMYHIFNRQDDQAWTNNVVYNGQMSARRSPLVFAGENWRQRIGFSLIFQRRVL
jgi:hypothetical protein